MKSKLKYLALANGILTIIGGIVMILHGLDLIPLSKPAKIAIAAVLCINAVVNCMNYSGALKQQKE